MERGSIEIIKKASEIYSLPWVLGFSGGKDSTTALSLLIGAMKQGVKIPRLYVVYADTLFEQPVLHKETLDTMGSLKGIPDVEPVIVKPKEGEDYVSMVLDNGYPVPSWYFRWCVDRLKIRPVKRFMNTLGRAVKVLGVRSDESQARKRTTMVNGERPAIINGNNPTVRPIITWTESDVVSYLRSTKRWDGRSFDYLINLYGYEINDACAPNTFCYVRVGNPGLQEKTTAYTSVRFGCWLCTVVKRNKMPVSETLEKARKKLREISDSSENRVFVGGKPRKLNENGRREIAKVMLEALEKEPDAFGYDREELRGRLESIIFPTA
ncbi:MAG: phosphoadenosine phosphosulfate reductase family protein [Nitrososphaerota archaeon]|nr:phosphoadenosine phosphosulfate reductase family protein [Nitrososphaerota archaeon]